MASPTPTMVGIVGWKNSGKTTLVVRLIETLTQRGLKIATVKHAHHAPRPADGTTDSERHKRAGAFEVIAVFPDSWDISGQLQDTPPPDLAEIATRLRSADLILVEGYKQALIPKIEVRRRDTETQRPLAPDDPNIIAIAADYDVEERGLPVLALDDIDAVVTFVERLRSSPAARPAPHLRREERVQTNGPRAPKGAFRHRRT